MSEEKETFIRFLLTKQLITEKGAVWLQLFKNLIALILIITFVILVLKQIKIPQEFNLLLGIVIGFYFKITPHKNTEL